MVLVMPMRCHTSVQIVLFEWVKGRIECFFFVYLNTIYLNNKSSRGIYATTGAGFLSTPSQPRNHAPWRICSGVYPQAWARVV
jgi:hypothetical protein